MLPCNAHKLVSLWCCGPPVENLLSRNCILDMKMRTAPMEEQGTPV